MDENKHGKATEDLAETVLVVANAGVNTFFWLWSLVFGAIAALMFVGNLRTAALLMLGTALLVNPSFIQYAFKEAARNGHRPPSIFAFFIIAFGLFCGSLFVAAGL